jgi:glutamine---fructose-6-phosphate transaminase (isomerizing)
MTTDRVDLFRYDIAASPAALQRLLDAWSAPDLGGRQRIAMCGLGSSRYAALIATAVLRSGGANAWVDYPSPAHGSPPADDLVLVAVSASGSTREVVAAAERHRGRSLVVAVTERPDSRLGDAADVVVPLLAGVEGSGIACRTYRATIAALSMLTGALTPTDLAPSVAGISRCLATGDGWLGTLVDRLDGAPTIDVLAEGPFVGLAEQAALMLREAPRLTARAWETGDWLHTGVYLAWPGHRAMLYPGSEADAEVKDTVGRRGGELVVVPGFEPGQGSTPAVDQVRRSIEASVVAELLAAELWVRATAERIDP